MKIKIAHSASVAVRITCDFGGKIWEITCKFHDKVGDGLKRGRNGVRKTKGRQWAKSFNAFKALSANGVAVSRELTPALHLLCEHEGNHSGQAPTPSPKNKTKNMFPFGQIAHQTNTSNEHIPQNAYFRCHLNKVEPQRLNTRLKRVTKYYAIK